MSLKVEPGPIGLLDLRLSGPARLVAQEPFSSAAGPAFGCVQGGRSHGQRVRGSRMR